jgi:hydrogenase expression/formation protein HypC
MCLGVPGKILEKAETAPGELAGALVEFAGLRRKVCVALVSDAQPGDYVLVHAGIALSRIDAAEAERLLEHLRTMGTEQEELLAP